MPRCASGRCRPVARRRWRALDACRSCACASPTTCACIRRRSCRATTGSTAFAGVAAVYRGKPILSARRRRGRRRLPRELCDERPHDRARGTSDGSPAPAPDRRRARARAVAARARGDRAICRTFPRSRPSSPDGSRAWRACTSRLPQLADNGQTVPMKVTGRRPVRARSARQRDPPLLRSESGAGDGGLRVSGRRSSRSEVESRMRLAARSASWRVADAERRALYAQRLPR